MNYEVLRALIKIDGITVRSVLIAKKTGNETVRKEMI